MRNIWGGLVAVTLAGSAQGAALWNDRVAQWFTGAYTNEQTGNFNHCAASATYKNGILLIFAVNVNYGWTMGFANPKWQLKPGNQYSVRYWVDTGEPEFGMATAVSPQMPKLF
jgi:hypothetical protein